VILEKFYHRLNLRSIKMATGKTYKDYRNAVVPV
jgi:hypothetical protein